MYSRKCAVFNEEVPGIPIDWKIPGVTNFLRSLLQWISQNQRPTTAVSPCESIPSFPHGRNHESWWSPGFQCPKKSGISMKRNLRGSWQSFVNMCLEVQVGNKGEKRYAGALCALIWNLQKYIYNGGLMIAYQLLVKDAVSPKMLLSKKRNSKKKTPLIQGMMGGYIDIFIINQSDNQMIWFLLEEFR